MVVLALARRECGGVNVAAWYMLIRSAATSFTWSVRITKQGTPKFYR
jgi:hypothetical protein